MHYIRVFTVKAKLIFTEEIHQFLEIINYFSISSKDSFVYNIYINSLSLRGKIRKIVNMYTIIWKILPVAYYKMGESILIVHVSI